jgi:phthiocerol/phenolphthiocerol synthesis type-I polyketide synthase E
VSDVGKLIANLLELGVELWLENGDLRYRAKKGVLTPERLGELRARKPEIVGFLYEKNAALPAEQRHDVAQAAVARIWRDVLQLERVEPHDNFLALGGTSLLAIQVVTRLREKYAIRFSPLALYEAPTVSQLASIICERLAEQHAAIAARAHNPHHHES